MGERLAGKVTVVTGAGQGIGQATARLFKREGAKVFAADLVADKLADLDCDGRFAFDVRDAAAIREMAAQTGPIHVLVNCTGYAPQNTILDVDDELYDRTFDINAKSMHHTMQAYLPGMIEQGGGSIVNVASVVSSLKGASERYVYAGTKGAVIGLTKAVAFDFAKWGIRANAICPGTILTPTLHERIAETAAAKSIPLAEAEQQYVDRQAMGRLGKAEEIAALALYLASDESAFTTGQAHIIDGGWSL